MSLTANFDGYGLLIGEDPRSRALQYYPSSAERCLLTIAPPGSGKTQCFMLPNLMMYQGPAVVIDVKGELWRATSKQRNQYGPVYRVDLDNPEASDCYNPFTIIRSDPLFAWSDSQTFADQVYVRQATRAENAFYDTQSVQLIAAMACFVAMTTKGLQRNPMQLAAYVSAGDMPGFLSRAKEMTQVPSLVDAANALSTYPKDTMGNLTATARSCLVAWSDPNIARISKVSDWTPDMIRNSNATLYIMASPDALERNRALVRVLIGQHLSVLLSQPVDRASPWVQFFIDEAPQLGNLSQLRKAIETGRSQKLRLWIVAQWRGQLTEAYGKETADGMIASCGLQTYLNPSLSDGTANAVSEAIGRYENRIDDVQRLIVSPQKLAGPDFRNDVIVFDHDVFVRLRKVMFHRNAEMNRAAGSIA